MDTPLLTLIRWLPLLLPALTSLTTNPIPIKPHIAFIASPPAVSSELGAVEALAATPVPTPAPTVIPTIKPTPRDVVAPQSNRPEIPGSSPNDVQSTIIFWANHYGVSSAQLLRVAKCESGYSPTAQNLGYTAGGGHPSGIFQFLPQTFYANAARAGVANPNLWDYKQQAQVAAYMFRVGQSKQWQCK